MAGKGSTFSTVPVCSQNNRQHGCSRRRCLYQANAATKNDPRFPQQHSGWRMLMMMMMHHFAQFQRLD
jgi:hypothetical protein